ncbi:MAG TPA: sulfite exporter TauE/SafE family protein [Gaiellaceae bacterium]
MILIGFVGGIFAGLFGVGGGIIFVPTLALGLGLTQLHAEATSLLAILPTAAVGSWRQIRYGNVRLRTAAVVGIGSVLGVELGVAVAVALPEHLLRRLFAVFLIVTAAHLVWRTRRA